MADRSVKLDYLELSGFRGVRDRLRIDLSPSFSVISGRNGSGKSTLCDAIEFALSGTISKYEDGKEKGETVADYTWWVGDTAPANRYVILGLMDLDGNAYSVTRTPTECSVKGVEDGQRLAELVGTRNAPTPVLSQLCRALIIRDEMIAAQSLDMPERDRYAFVRSALGSDMLERFDKEVAELRRRLRGRKQAAESRYAEARKEVELLETQLSEMKAEVRPETEVSEAEEKLRQIVNAPEASIDAVLESGSRRLNERLSTAATIERLQDRVAKYRSQMKKEQQDEERAADLPEIREQLEKQLSVIRREKTTLDEGRKDYTEERTNEASLAALLHHGRELGLQEGGCPLCGQKQSHSVFSEALVKLSTKIAAEAVKRQEQAAHAEKLERKLTAISAKLKSVASEMDTLAARRTSLVEESEAIIEDCSRLGLEVDEVPTDKVLSTMASRKRHEAAEIRSSLNVVETSKLVDRIASLEQTLNSTQARSEEAENLLQETGVALSKLTELRGGVRRAIGEVVNERLSAIEPLLRDLYARIQPHADWTDIGYKLRGDVRRFLSLEVGDGYNPRFMFSSGQRRAVGLVFLLAVYLSTKWNRLQTLIVDDPIQHIDDFRALHLTEVLAAVRREDRQLICTVEDEELARLLCRRLRPSQDAPGQHIRMTYTAGKGVECESITAIDALRDHVLLSA